MPANAPPALAPSATRWPAPTWTSLLACLTAATLLVHGFHPMAEDGGLYAAGIEYKLDPSLFPHYTAFVTEHLRFSLFAPALALAVRVTHLSLPSILFLTGLAVAFGTLAAAREVLRRCFADERAQLTGVAMLAAGWTLPIGGTSLFLMDPYVTARSLVMPLSLLAIAFALDSRHGKGKQWLRHPALRCAVFLVVAAAFHPLMAAYTLLFVWALRATSSRHPRTAWTLFALLLLLLCFVINLTSPAESAAEIAAVITRYYWFLSRWHWYEDLGLLGPLAILGLVLLLADRPRASHPHTPRKTLCRTSILLGVLCTLCALLLAHESAATHAFARLQILRIFVLLYAVMLLLLGASIQDACSRMTSPTQRLRHLCRRTLPAFACVAMAAGMFVAERAIYPASPHIELPWRMAQTQNPWVQAFLWARRNTPRGALFALDAKYVNTDGEDAQTFRAISLRSALPDFSKDGGEASIDPALAPEWLAAATAQKDLSLLTDADRDPRLRPFRVSWMVLHATAATAHACPYRNRVVKVCRIEP